MSANHFVFSSCQEAMNTCSCKEILLIQTAQWPLLKTEQWASLSELLPTKKTNLFPSLLQVLPLGSLMAYQFCLAMAVSRWELPINHKHRTLSALLKVHYLGTVLRRAPGSMLKCHMWVPSQLSITKLYKLHRTGFY